MAATRLSTREFAERCFKQIEGFGEYGFPESHAASFALLVYASAWMKCHYPDVFAAALLNSQPMGFYAPAQIVRDAREHGVEVRAVDVNRLDWDCTLETERRRPRAAACIRAMPDERTTSARPCAAARLSPDQRIFRGRRQDHRKRCAARGFDSVRDLWLRTGLQPAALERLAAADAFRSLGLDRRDALWAVRALQRAGRQGRPAAVRARRACRSSSPTWHLPPMLLGEQVVEDYRHLHLSLKAHPVSFLRGDLDARGIVRHEALAAIKSGRRVTVAGLVLVRQRPGTANGVIFMTLEDETGIANTIVWPQMFETFRPIVLGARLVSVTGKLQNEKGVIHVVAERVDDLTPLLAPSVRAERHRSSARPLRRGEAPDPGNRSEKRAHPRRGNSLVRLLREQPDLAEQLTSTHAVMPKGRNFH